MKRAIIYGRKSTNKQSVETIETQIAECRKWAEKNNAMIVKIYDDSESGQGYNVESREGFQQIKEDAKNGKMDYALIYRIDRFARSVKDYFNNESILEDYGVKIIVVSMPHLHDADIVVKALYVAMAEQFSKSLSEDVYVKMRTFANKHSFLGGKPPYGFTLVEKDGKKTFEIVEEEAAGIRLAYDLYLHGYGYTNVSKKLAEKGFLNALNEPFTPSHISKMLKSKKYNGWYVFGMREKINGKDVKTKDAEKIIEIPDIFPKIIDDETFSTVQNRMSKNITRNKYRKRHYPLTGMIVCGECGRAVTGACTSHQNRNVKFYSYYKCTGRRVNGCTVKSIRADFLEDYILEKIRKNAFDDDFTSSLISDVEKNLSGDVSSFKKMLVETESNLHKKDAQIKEATKDKYNPEKKISDTLYNELMNELNAEKSALELKLSHIHEQLNINDKTKEIRSYIKWLRSNLENATEEVKNAVLSQAVQSIILHADKIEVFLNLSSINNKSNQKHCLPNDIIGVPLSSIGETARIHIGGGLSVVGFCKII